MRLGYALSSATLLVLLAVPAYAQTTTQSGFALNRFDPSERGSDWFALESLDLRGHNRWAVGVVGDWAYKPLVLYDSAGDERTAARDHLLSLFVLVGDADPRVATARTALANALF